MLVAGYYVSEPRANLLDTPGGLVRRFPWTSPSPDRAKKKNGARGPVLRETDVVVQGFRMRSSSDLPIACVRFTTFSLRRIFCTWFFTVSGLILRIAPISKFDLPR